MFYNDVLVIVSMMIVGTWRAGLGVGAWSSYIVQTLESHQILPNNYQVSLIRKFHFALTLKYSHRTQSLFQLLQLTEGLLII